MQNLAHYKIVITDEYNNILVQSDRLNQTDVKIKNIIFNILKYKSLFVSYQGRNSRLIRNNTKLYYNLYYNKHQNGINNHQEDEFKKNIEISYFESDAFVDDIKKYFIEYNLTVCEIIRISKIN